MKPNHYYNPKLQHYALENRSNMTKAEACLWKYALSKRRMLGFQFRRQRPIENYIVDFVCLPLKLIIEVDGYSHLIPENEVKDKIREERLITLGYTVVRFKDEEVLGHINMVREHIEGWINKLNTEKKSTLALRALPPAGDTQPYPPLTEEIIPKNLLHHPHSNLSRL